MKTKTKLIASIMSICLVCAVFAIGVFALKNANLKIGGDVSFQATGVEAHIKNASVFGAVTPTELAASDAEGEVINTSMTQADINSTFATWQNIKLDFDAEANDIVLKFDIANTSTNANNYIEIDYSYTFSNPNPNVGISSGGDNAENEWENNNYFLLPQADAATASYSTFKLEFWVLNKELNVPADTTVDLTIELKHTTPVAVTLTDGLYYDAQNVAYSLDAENSVATTKSYPENTDIVIPSVVSNAGKNYVVTTLGGEDDGYGEYKIKSIDFPNTITSTEYAVFGESTIGGDFRFGRGLANFKSSYAFDGCDFTGSIYFTSSQRAFNYDDFQYGYRLTESIVVEPGNRVFDSRDNCNALIETATNKLFFGNKNTIIPEGVVEICTYAFFNCTGLTTIEIPSNVSKIGYEAFSGHNTVTLKTVVFKDPIGWSGVDATMSGDTFSNLDLSDPEQNATYLINTYYSYDWTKA